jgi:uncharacterized RDD family membrane protein YckC
LPAYRVDVGIRALLTAGFAATVAISLGSLGLAGLGAGLGLAFWFVMSWFYGGLFETYWNGQTPGKRMFSLRVVGVDGRPINAAQAILRNILRAADSLPVVPVPGGPPVPIVPLYVVGLVTPMFNARYQRLGDLVCGTMVVVEEKQYGATMIQLKEPEVIELAGRLPAGVRVSRSLGRALVKYVSRRKSFGRERRAEIAQRLGEAVVEQYRLPPETNHDLLLCALYYRAFIADAIDASAEAPRGAKDNRRLAAAPIG